MPPHWIAPLILLSILPLPKDHQTHIAKRLAHSPSWTLLIQCTPQIPSTWLPTTNNHTHSQKLKSRKIHQLPSPLLPFAFGYMDPFSSIKSSLHQGSHSITFHPTSQLTDRNHTIHYIHEYPLTKKVQGYLHLLFKKKDIHTLHLRWISFSTTKFSIISQKSPSIFSTNFIPISMITCCHRLLVWL